MMKLIALMLLGLVSLVEGEVVNSFADSCPKFFIKDQNNRPVTPTVLVSRDQNGNLIQNQYRQICQKYNRRYRYATLYDTKNRIPVYSAYLYTGYAKVATKSTWMIEPGLDDYMGEEMTTEAKAKAKEKAKAKKKAKKKAVGKHQAVNADYIKQKPYQRGHLYPRCHNCNQNQSDSTYTLTNAAPQDGGHNKDWYGQVERVSSNVISNLCQGGSAHVVTGVVPGEVWLKKKNVRGKVKERVNVPSCFWSAFCCTHKLKKSKYSRGFLAPTKTGMRKLNSNKIHDWKMVAEEMSVQELNGKLTGLYATPFKVFGNLCLKSKN